MRSMFATIKSVTDSGPGLFEAIASAPTIDRDGEIVAKGAFNPLPRQVPIHIDHRYSADSLVGSARPYYSGEHLMVSGSFAGTPRGQEVRQLVTEGHLTHMSVGFRDTVRSKNADGVPVITRAELLEVSFVTVSSNREALVLSAKSPREDHDDLVVRARAIALRAELAMMQADLAQMDAKAPGRWPNVTKGIAEARATRDHQRRLKSSAAEWPVEGYGFTAGPAGLKRQLGQPVQPPPTVTCIDGKQVALPVEVSTEYYLGRRMGQGSGGVRAEVDAFLSDNDLR